MPENKPTQVREMRVKTGIEQEPILKARTARAEKESSSRPRQSETTAQVTTYETSGKWSRHMLNLDKLLRNVAVAGVLLMVVVAARNAENTPLQSVFSAIQTSSNMEWDENLGKLSFVSNLIPESVQAVWSKADSVSVMAPIHGEVVHAWSREEPYLELQSTVSDVRAAASGEIMSIAHGLDEEYIIRLRHTDSSESLYGNLADCHLEVGDHVFQGDIIATLIEGKPLAFELRKDGRSIDPEGMMQSIGE